METNEICNSLMKYSDSTDSSEILINRAVQRLRELELEVMLLQQDNKPDTLTGSEALFGFLGWLTTQENSMTFGLTHNADLAVELLEKFVNVNGLQEPRVGWENNLKHPPVKPIQDKV